MLNCISRTVLKSALKRPQTKQEKINCPHSCMHGIVIQYKQAAYTSILTKVGNSRHVDVRLASPLT